MGSCPTVAYDMRGHGGSSKPVEVGNYTDGASWADDLRAVLAECGGAAPVVVGWSPGGLVLTHYLARHSDAGLGGVVFVSAVTDGSPSLLSPLAAALLKGLGQASIEDRAASCPGFVDASFATRVVPAERTAMIVANASVPTAVYEAASRLPPADPALLSRVRVPTLIVHGLRDALVSPEMARRAAAGIPGSRLELYERSGHGPLIDEPARLARDLVAFTRSIG